jgi:hypothetical protein
MKTDLIFWIIAALVVCFAIWVNVEKSDEIVFEYDPATGKQKVTTRKNRMLEGPKPLTLEGQ